MTSPSTSSSSSSSYGRNTQSFASPPQKPSYSQPPQQPSDAPPQADYGSSQYYEPPSQQDYGAARGWRLDSRYSRIANNYNSLEEVTEALSRAGLESSSLIVGIDFSKSNEWTGAKSFNSKSLHHIGPDMNPYEQAISIIGKTLAAFDEDNTIPCYGFGDASTHDQDVFSFYPGESFCNGFEEVLSRYREIVPNLRLAGPTSFAPVIEMAMNIVEQSGGQFHVLLIIADGQVTRSADTVHGQLSPQEQKTVQAIVEASNFPLSIILVGVGDGPWDMMKEFDNNIPSRAFDNFQFVNFTDIMAKNVSPTRKETEFALSALMEIPSQYKATIQFNILGGRRGKSPKRVALPPPIYGIQSFSNSSVLSVPCVTSSHEETTPASSSQAAPHSTYDHQFCPIFLVTNPKDTAFSFGHQTLGNTVDFGYDLYREFLIRVKNIRSLGKFRAVSRQFLEILSGERFADEYSAKHTKKEPFLLITFARLLDPRKTAKLISCTNDTSKTSVLNEILKTHVVIANAADIILLSRSHRNRKFEICLCNNITGQGRRLPVGNLTCDNVYGLWSNNRDRYCVFALTCFRRGPTEQEIVVTAQVLRSERLEWEQILLTVSTGPGPIPFAIFKGAGVTSESSGLIYFPLGGGFASNLAGFLGLHAINQTAQFVPLPPEYGVMNNMDEENFGVVNEVLRVFKLTRSRNMVQLTIWELSYPEAMPTWALVEKFSFLPSPYFSVVCLHPTDTSKFFSINEDSQIWCNDFDQLGSRHICEVPAAPIQKECLRFSVCTYVCAYTVMESGWPTSI